MNDRSIEERNDQFDSAVREKFAGYEPQVPHALWNRISTELDMGEASDETAPMAEHHERSSFRKWRFAIAAAVILTLTVGTLLYTLNPVQKTALTATSTTTKVKATTIQTAATQVLQVTGTKMVAQAAPVVKKSVKVIHTPVSSAKTSSETPVAINTNEPAAVETAPAKEGPATPDAQLASAPVLTENKPVEVGNIPLASLNFLSTPSSVNDEITVIKSSDKKKRHGRKEEQSTRVIVLEKKFDTKPDIRYQVPVRF